MGEASGFPQRPAPWQLPNSELPNLQMNLGYPGLISAQKNGGQQMFPPGRVLPPDMFSGVPNPRISQSYEPQGWFYCLPRFRQALAPTSDNLVLEDKLPTTTFDKWRDFSMPNAGTVGAQKKFVVFDRSGDQTTLIYSSGNGVPTERLPPWTTKQLCPRSAVNDIVGSNTDHNNHFGPLSVERIHENPETDVQSEMQEDTEELNALLYSDDDTDYSDDGDDDDDDEVTSTGHSPSTMTDHERRGLSEESNEEIASSIWPVKRRKTSGGDNNQLPSLMDTATSYLNHSIGSEDDAKSSSADGKKYAYGLASISGDKKIKRERIRETVNVLQSIVPSGKEKNAIVILDEAINYLKSLKRKAEALGLAP